MKILQFIIIAGLSGTILMGADYCGSNDAEEADQEAVEKQQKHYQKSQPMPFFEFSLERDAYIQLYEARNERVATWTVWRSDTGIVEGDCASIGYPIPFDTSLTNPLQGIYIHSSGGVVTIEQPEPNGLYSSKNSIATWIRCLVKVNDETVEAPFYVESKVTTYPFPVDVDYQTNRATPVQNAKPSVTIKAKADK